MKTWIALEAKKPFLAKCNDANTPYGDNAKYSSVC